MAPAAIPVLIPVEVAAVVVDTAETITLEVVEVAVVDLEEDLECRLWIRLGPITSLVEPRLV